MLQTYINNLINQIPKQHIKGHIKIKGKPLKVDIVFEGGLFNGSYQLGFLNYIKKLESNNFIKVNRISGCSIGSIIAMFYFLDVSLSDSINFVTNNIYSHVKKYYNINVFDKFFEYFKQNLPSNILELINGRFFVSYYDITKCKQHVKSNYKSINDIFDTIRRSCSLPFVIDKTIFYKDKYIDGLHPYMFKPTKDIKIINLNIINRQKIGNWISIKNEKTNTIRVIDGIIDTHTFFSTNFSSNMCSYVNDWNIINTIKYYMVIKMYKTIIYIIHNLYILNKIICNSTDDKLNIDKLITNIYLFLLEKYCV
jgi:hypothetical protein